MYEHQSQPPPEPPEPVDPLIGPIVSAGESRDGTGAGDHNVAFEFGHPQSYLTTIVQGRLTVMRGYVLDASHEDHLVRYGGDMEHVFPHPSGLLVPYEWRATPDA